MTETPLFDSIAFTDPLSGAPLEPLISARTPAGVPVCGALRVANTATGYPIVDSVARVTPELAQRHASWLVPFGLAPAARPGGSATDFQQESTVESFGWQWTWSSAMRTEACANRSAGSAIASGPAPALSALMTLRFIRTCSASP